MSTEIRQVELLDFEDVFELFGKRKSRTLLKWIYGHPCAAGRSAYVAVQEGRIIGSVGFVKSTYMVNGERLTGLIPLSWEVEKENRGMIGIRLLLKALNSADFYMGMDGSEDMKAIFGGLNFKKIGEGKNARKVLRPVNYLKTLRKVGVKDIFRTVSHIYNNLSSAKSRPRIQLAKINACQTVESSEEVISGMFYNTISPEHVLWLDSSPDMTACVFQVNIDNTVYAPVHCYIKNVRNGYKRGQITHVPPLKPEHRLYYRDIVLWIEDYFRKLGITSISTLVTNPDLEAVLGELKYTFDKKTRPIVIKANEETEKLFAGATIHLSYAESDKSIRNI